MRRNNMFWGVVLVFAGALALLGTMGLLPVNFWQLFWPGLLVILGIWVLLGPKLFHGETLKTEDVSIPVDNATEAEIHFNHGAGRFLVDAQTNPGLLLSGSFGGGVRQDLRRYDNRIKLRLETPSNTWWGFPWTGPRYGLEWKLSLSRDLPLKLVFHTGASESLLNLSELRVVELRIETGASSTEVTLPGNAGTTRVDVEAGAASVKLRLPDGVAGRIRIESGLSGKNVDTSRFPYNGRFYETPGFDTATNRAEIVVKTGVGSIDVH